MRRLWFLMILLSACGRTPPAHDAEPAVDAAPTSATSALSAAPDTKQPPPEDVARRSLRHQDYAQQHALELPPGFFPEARALLPPLGPNGPKLVAFALERNMALTQPAPGRRKAMLRWVSMEPEEALRAGLASHLKAQGWVVADPQLRTPLQDAARGRSTITVETPADQAARVELVLEGREPAAPPPVENPLHGLHRPMDWLDDADATVVGYELGHYHAVRFGGAFTDVQRVAVTVRLADASARDAMLLRLPDRVAQAGFRLEAKDSGLYRGEDGGIFVVRPAKDPHELTLHHQQRWTRPQSP